VHSFTRATDGAYPIGDLAIDPAGNLYGTTSLGGGAEFNGGTAFQLRPPQAGGSEWSETILHAFGLVFRDADSPGTLIRTKVGTLLGAAGGGGRNDDGTVFALSPPKASQNNWRDKVLHRFPDSASGAGPNSACTKGRTERCMARRSVSVRQPISGWCSAWQSRGSRWEEARKARADPWPSFPVATNTASSAVPRRRAGGWGASVRRVWPA
jgi:hypothetical protein